MITTRICPDCHKEHHRTAPLCQACYIYYRSHPDDTPMDHLPKKGEIIYSKDKTEIRCHVCGKLYAKPLQHAYYTHNISESEYRKAYHIYSRQCMVGIRYLEKLKYSNKKHEDIVVKKNLIARGHDTRFRKGQEIEGRGHHYKKGDE